MAEKTTVNVNMRTANQIASEVFVQEVARRTAWNKTQQVAAVARRLAPRKTGALRKSITARKSRTSTPILPVYEVYSDLRYAAPMETGYRHWRSGRFVPGFHYMERALKSVRW